MEAFFHSDDFTLIHGDCFEVLKGLKDVDMVFADPPYFLSNDGLTIQSGKIVSVNKGKWDKLEGSMHDFNYQWISLAKNALKPNGTIWISGTMHNIFSIYEVLKELNFKILNVITWRKLNPPPNFSCRTFTHSTEIIIWARKEQKVAHYYNYDLMKKLNGGKQMTDVWQLPAIARWEKSCGKHPTQKPLGVLARLIQASTKPDAWILDPFSGSATTGIAANLLGRRYLGLELYDDFLSISKARREEIDNISVRSEYLKKLTKTKMIAPSNNYIVAEELGHNYGVPWLYE